MLIVVTSDLTGGHKVLLYVQTIECSSFIELFRVVQRPIRLRSLAKRVNICSVDLSSQSLCIIQLGKTLNLRRIILTS